MKVGLIDVDRHTTFPRMKFPNLALMKISGWHKQQGDEVKWCDNGLERFDLVYKSKVFDETYSRDIDWIPNSSHIMGGGVPDITLKTNCRRRSSIVVPIIPFTTAPLRKRKTPLTDF